MTNTDREPVAWRVRAGVNHPLVGSDPFPWRLSETAPVIGDGAQPEWFDVQALYAAPPPTAPTAATPAMLDAGWKATGKAQVFAGTDTPETRPGWRVLDGEVNLSDVWSAMASVARPAPIVEDVLSMIDEWVRSEQSFSLGAAMPLSRRNRLAARILELFQRSVS